MVIALIGESCTGKSTLADKLKADFGATVYSGKDYLRLAKSQTEAENAFKKLLLNAQNGENIIYVISERAHLRFLPEKCFKVLLTADLQTIKDRFAARMHGNLPPPVAAMLEKNHGSFDDAPHEFNYRADGDYDELKEKIRGFVNAN